MPLNKQSLAVAKKQRHHLSNPRRAIPKGHMHWCNQPAVVLPQQRANYEYKAGKTQERKKPKKSMTFFHTNVLTRLILNCALRFHDNVAMDLCIKLINIVCL